MGSIVRSLLQIAPAEATFARRRFRGASEPARERLEEVGRTFLVGYHAALEGGAADEVAARLAGVETERRGFAFEGAAMGLALLDRLAPVGGGRFARFLAGPGDAHRYMLHVGAGWAMARLPFGLERALGRMDPLLRWLALDGYGFHEAYFHPGRTVTRGRVPRRLAGYARRAFDQGVGRGLWFACGADPEAAARAVARFDAARHGDLWAGVALAAAYAGGAGRDGLESLARAGVRHPADLAQGAAIAAGARLRAGNPAPHTDQACRVFCGRGAPEAGRAALDEARRAAPRGELPAFEAWRLRLRLRFLQSPALA